MKDNQGKLTRREFIQTSAMGAAGLAMGGGMAGCSKGPSQPLPTLVPLSGRPQLDPSERPNIILLFSDQHRYDAMGCMGNPVIQTPNLDGLAARGVNLTNTHCAAPICQPSRASILTGLYPHQHGVTYNVRDELDPNFPTMPRQLQKTGYKTAIIGKTHYWNIRGKDSVGFSLLKWGIDVREKEDYIRHFGFDDVIEEFDLYVHAYKKAHIYTRYSDYLKERGSLEKYKKQIQSVWRKSATYWDGRTSVLSQEENLTSFTTREATNWIKQQDQGRPFFLNVGYVAPHVPLISDPIWADYYKDKEIPLGNQDFPEKPNEIWGKWLDREYKNSNTHMLTRDYLMNSARHYYGMVSLIDQGIGDIVKTLEEQGVADNTWILYSSDHGEMLGDHKLMGKTVFYKPSVQVPNIITPPKGMPAKTVDAPIEGVDIPATILDIAGAEKLPKSSGQSLLPIVKGEAPKKEVAFSEVGPTIDEKVRLFVSAATERYRLTYETTTQSPCELFDLQEDPGELTNRINDPAVRKIRDDMISDLILPHMSD
ncbi:MAG: sulfatase-like hydrolase/transferase [Deltaproteobacteria bacterium]|nr:sulfatase-like hydrolase/transferase [Deltaproteobacteria bacterium]